MRERIEMIAKHPRTRGAALLLALAVLLTATALAFSKQPETPEDAEPPEPPQTVAEPEAFRQTDVWYADLDGDETAARVVLDTQEIIDEGTAEAAPKLAEPAPVPKPPQPYAGANEQRADTVEPPSDGSMVVVIDLNEYEGGEP